MCTASAWSSLLGGRERGGRCSQAPCASELLRPPSRRSQARTAPGGPGRRSCSHGLGRRHHRELSGGGDEGGGGGDSKSDKVKGSLQSTRAHAQRWCNVTDETEQNGRRVVSDSGPTHARTQRACARPSLRAPRPRRPHGDHAAAGSASGTEFTGAPPSPAFRHFRNAFAFPGTRARSHLQGRPDFPGRGRAGGRNEEGGPARQTPGPAPVAAA